MDRTITVNGAPMAIQAPCTVADLLRRLETPLPAAVEVNRQVVPRARHEEQELAAGDVVEIVTLVGGG